MIWKIVDIVRKIVKLPFGITLACFMSPVWFLLCDWTDEGDREQFRNLILNLLW